jgi:putative heme transporter
MLLSIAYNVNMSFRMGLSIFTVIFLAIIIFLSRHEIVHAWELLGKVNLWILLLLIPAQILVYYSAGEMIFTYLRSKKSIDDIKGNTLTRIALELNFVNHILPSGGVSGVSYVNWRLGHFGVSAGRATMAQVVKYVGGFGAFIALLLIAVVAVTIDGQINRWIILISSMLVGAMISLMLALVFVLSNKRRIDRFAVWIHRAVNGFIRRISFGRSERRIQQTTIMNFFDELHHDFIALNKDKRLLIKPFMWGLVNVSADALLFLITFWALGVAVNPAIILIAYGVASLAGFFVITPGGAGAYEAIMVSFLAIAGVTSGVAIAGIVLTRVILLIGTILFGYLFYQHALIKYGKYTQPPLHS